jgi:hypothetical protein
MRMLQRGSESRLATKPFGAEIGSQFRRKDLQDDTAAEGALGSDEDACHHAASELALY